MRNSQIQSEAGPRFVLNLSAPPAGQKGEGAPEPEAHLVEIFDELRVPVSWYLRRIGLSKEDSEEIVQEVFFRLFKHLLEEGREDNLRSWVYRVAHNLAIDQYKHQGRCATKSPQEWAGLSDLLIDQSPNPEELMISKEKIAGMNRAILSLSTRQAQLLYLRMEGFRYREIGETLGMRVSTVAASLRMAIEKLRENENNPQ